MVDFDELRQRYEAGDQSALHAAANSCRNPRAERVTVPTWVIEVLVEHNIEYMRDLAPGKEGKGRHARWARQHRADLLHLIRYSEVCRALQQGISNAEAFEQVAATLKDSPFSDGLVTADAIRKSFELIRRERQKDPERFRRRFHFASPGWMLGKK